MSIEKQISGAEAVQQMQRIEHAVTTAIKPFQNGRTEAILFVFALVRIARVILRFYSKADQDVFIPILKAFLEGREQLPGQSDSPLWMPGDPFGRVN